MFEARDYERRIIVRGQSREVWCSCISFNDYLGPIRVNNNSKIYPRVEVNLLVLMEIVETVDNIVAPRQTISVYRIHWLRINMGFTGFHLMCERSTIFIGLFCPRIIFSRGWGRRIFIWLNLIKICFKEEWIICYDLKISLLLNWVIERLLKVKNKFWNLQFSFIMLRCLFFLSTWLAFFYI